jgi:ketosteroid isomerase-like protein
MSEESTTPDLVEKVRAILEAADRAEFDRILAFYADDAVWVMATQSFKGVDAIRSHWEEWYENYADVRFGPPKIVDVGNGVVLAVVRHGGRPGGGVAELSQEVAFVYEWSDGLIVRVTASFDIDEARAAAERLAQERG